MQIWNEKTKMESFINDELEPSSSDVKSDNEPEKPSKKSDNEADNETNNQSGSE